MSAASWLPLQSGSGHFREDEVYDSASRKKSLFQAEHSAKEVARKAVVRVKHGRKRWEGLRNDQLATVPPI